ncbi:MAG: type II secretion system protein [Endozoicomonadaceae bacterium]|nr:type II secretion system protein [Endozoicomonadaceae bacterium]
MKSFKQKGFTAIELVIGLVIVSIAFSIIIPFIESVKYDYKVYESSNKFHSIIRSVQRRNAHDGFIFDSWLTNGTNPTSADTNISWDNNNFDDLIDLYLVARKNVGCGNLVNGWNPHNSDGTKDGGTETNMEFASLIPCNTFTAINPFNIQLEAVINADPLGSVNQFGLYLIMDNSSFDQFNNENNILNYVKLRSELAGVNTNLNGIKNVEFGTSGADLDDTSDDIIYTTAECQVELANDRKCDILVYLDFAGETNGRFLMTGGENFMMASLSFGESIAAGRQQCLKWDLSGTTWSSSLVDCGIEGGADNSEVTLVTKEANTERLTITDSANISHLCNVYQMEDEANGRTNLIPTPAPNNLTPCGFTKNGSIIQLASEVSHANRAYADEVVAEQIFSVENTLYSTINGATVLIVYDSAHNNIVYSIDNNGNANMAGNLSVSGDGLISRDLEVEQNLIVSQGGSINLEAGATFNIGDPSAAGTGLRFSKNDGTRTFSIDSTGLNLEIFGRNRDTSIKLSDSDQQIELEASGGIVSANGTRFHGSFSSFRDQLFDPVDGITSLDEKKLSELVTYDYAKHLDNTSSSIQIVGIDKVEGEFTELTKPDCLWFTKDSAYTNAQANPYKGLVFPDGESLARLILTPIFFKTYNASFGDNQLFASHGVHSSSTTWGIYLYLSGEGAFGTGAREDGAGSSLAMSVCDYNGISFPSKIL